MKKKKIKYFGFVPVKKNFSSLFSYISDPHERSFETIRNSITTKKRDYVRTKKRQIFSDP